VEDLFPEFTFAVMAYNQEDIIVEYLESVKYQIVNYGSEYRNNIIITDDCSKDDTSFVIERWISVNEQYFSKVEFVKNPVNKGTAYNLRKIISFIEEGSSFKLIAGDDIIASSNLYEACKKASEKRIISFYPLYLKRGEVSFGKFKLSNQFYYLKKIGKKMNHHFNMKAVRKSYFIDAPSAVFAKSLYISSRGDLLTDSFTLLEDGPLWYGMIKQNKDLEVEFSTDTISIYRYSEASVNRGKNEAHKRFSKEYKKLHELYMEDTKGFEKRYLKYKGLKHMRSSWLNPAHYFDVFTQVYRLGLAIFDTDFWRLVFEMRERVDEEQKHYIKINQSAKEFKQRL